MSRKGFTAPPQTPKKNRGFAFPRPSESKQTVVVDAGKRSLECDEELDFEELEATQVIPGPDDEISSSSSEDAEYEFRTHCREIMTEHGLENARAWFSIESRKFKKPKLEKK